MMEEGGGLDRDRLERAFRYAQVGRCVSSVVHDINNYLGAIQAYADLIKIEEQLRGESQEMLARIVNAVAQCNTLVSSLASISQKERPDNSVINAAAFVQETVALKLYDYKVARVPLEVVVPEPLPSLTGDLPKLRLALLYLLMNALEAVEHAGAKRVRISAAVASDRFRFEVWNAGPPIPEQEREILFAPFYTTKGGAHWGLGLTIARETARAHGGDLFYEPAKGFVMELPITLQPA